MLTDDPYLVADALFNLYEANKAALGLRQVFFGDVAMYPETPALTIDPGRLVQSRAGAMNKMHNEFTTHLLVYHSPIEDKSQSIRELMQYTQAVKQVYLSSLATRLLGDPSIGDPGQNLLLDGYVSITEPGFTIRQNSLVRTARITLFGMSETLMLN